MSIQYGKLCLIIIKQVFGDAVELVASALYDSISRTLSALVKTTHLTSREVTNALATLIKFRLVTYKPSFGNENIPEYCILNKNIIYILRYPKYVYLIESKFGNVGATITEELIRGGCLTAPNLLLKCFTTSDNKNPLKDYREVLLNMIRTNYIIRLPMPKHDGENEAVPVLEIADHEYFMCPEIDLNKLQQLVNNKSKYQETSEDPFWQINNQRFHQDFRDTIMISAIERKLGANAGDCLKYILKEMYLKTDPWQKQCSNPFTYAEIKQSIEKQSNNIELIKYLDNYFQIIAEDSLGFIRKTGEMGGGQYVVDLRKTFIELAIACIESVINEKYGSKAARIFRVIKLKKFIEQEEIQKEAMVPAKEAKLITYNLFQEQFVQIKTIRKAGGGGSGPAKSFFLFHVDVDAIVKMLLDTCYKALFNAITRSIHEKEQNKRLIDKHQKLESIVETIKERGESEEYIAELLETITPPEREILEKVKTRIKILSNAELVLEDTVFLLELYQYHNRIVQQNTKK